MSTLLAELQPAPGDAGPWWGAPDGKSGGPSGPAGETTAGTDPAVPVQALVELEVLEQIASTWRVDPHAVLAACPGADDGHILRAVHLLRAARAIQSGPFTEAAEAGRLSQDAVNVTARGVHVLETARARSAVLD